MCRHLSDSWGVHFRDWVLINCRLFMAGCRTPWQDLLGIGHKGQGSRNFGFHISMWKIIQLAHFRKTSIDIWGKRISFYLNVFGNF
jgi:hypothetical protein